MVSAVVTNPVDIIKVRQQLQTNRASLARASSVWAVGRSMVRNEGLYSLMIGTSASVAREGSYSLIRLGTYEMFKDMLKQSTVGILDPDGLTLKVAASVIAGTIGSAIANPTDLVKIRMQAYHPNGSPYRSMRHAFSVVYQGITPNATSTSLSSPPKATPGILNLYRGVFPTVARGWTVAAFQMPAYDHMKQYLKKHEVFKEGLEVHLASSLFAGLVVSMASNPVDVIKVRIMNDTTSRYRGILHCVSDVFRFEGPLAFYKGFGMCWARLGTHTVVTYMIYEQLRLVSTQLVSIDCYQQDTILMTLSYHTQLAGVRPL
ncbi:mitochondrial carrier [Clavulina sp. PMI_390]|nr:mitochondrial carrier [Clavulina sp. PMI_390]